MADFTITWRTTTANESVEIPTSGGGYNYSLDWGDGSAIETVTTNEHRSHTYVVAGDHTSSISGTFPHIRFDGSADASKVIAVTLGDVGWTNLFSSFRGCSITVLGTGDTSSVIDMSYAFFGNSDLTTVPLLDTSSVTDMSYVFFGNTSLTSLPVGFGLGMSNVTDASNFFFLGKLDTSEYDRLLIEIESVNNNNLVSFDGGESTYTTLGETARSALISDHTWSITDGGLVASEEIETNNAIINHYNQQKRLTVL